MVVRSVVVLCEMLDFVVSCKLVGGNQIHLKLIILALGYFVVGVRIMEVGIVEV